MYGEYREYGEYGEYREYGVCGAGIGNRNNCIPKENILILLRNHPVITFVHPVQNDILATASEFSCEFSGSKSVPSIQGISSKRFSGIELPLLDNVPDSNNNGYRYPDKIPVFRFLF